MKIYTYGIIDFNGEVNKSIEGLEGAYVYNISYHDIGICVTDFKDQLQDIDQTHALKHEEVVERLMARFTVLPFRFLTVFNSREDVLFVAREYYSDFRDNLDRLRNKVEFGIKVIWPGDTIRKRIINAYAKGNTNVSLSDNSPAKSFIKEKFENYKVDKEFEEEADRCIAIVDNFFSGFAAEKRLEKLKNENLLLNASYLVDKEKQSDFKRAFERLRSTPGDLKYLFSGPWPPYNFIVLTKKTDMFKRKSTSQNLTSEGEV